MDYHGLNMPRFLTAIFLGSLSNNMRFQIGWVDKRWFHKNKRHNSLLLMVLIFRDNFYIRNNIYMHLLALSLLIWNHTLDSLFQIYGLFLLSLVF